MRLTRRQVLGMAGGAALAGGCAWIATHARSSSTRHSPNILLIVVDDLPYAAPGGHAGVPTPNIDALMASGVTFSSGYVAASICAPSRAGIMTGTCPLRYGFEFNPTDSSHPGADFGLPLDRKTLAEALHAGGYATGLVGKWHLGEAEKFRPNNRGFDEFFGFLAGSHAYESTPPGKPVGVFRQDKRVNEKDYLTDAFTREAISFIERHQSKPFFLYLAYSAPHSPFQAPQAWIDKIPDGGDPKKRAYLAMIAALDDGIGRVTKRLHDLKLDDNTLIFFLSDNGGALPLADNAPLRGGKGVLYEGGVRVPFSLTWPGHITPGTTYAEPVSSLDIFPTSMAAAGIAVPKGAAADGVDLVPFLQPSATGSPHEMLFWRLGNRAAMRRGQWKLMTNHKSPPQLFDVVLDPGENKDLADANSKRTHEMLTDLERTLSHLPPPAWAAPPGE